jgi:hypothetical protein
MMKKILGSEEARFVRVGFLGFSVRWQVLVSVVTAFSLGPK